MSNNKNIKVAVGLSGGVDSSVVAALMKNQGYDVRGLIMEIYDESWDLEQGNGHSCFGPDEEKDVEMAKRICEKLDIPFYSLDLREEYNTNVLNYFKEEYLTGRTPNPCIICNQKMKFGYLLDRALEMDIDFDCFATGHYARIEKKNGEYRLLKAKNKHKDQSYFLYGLPKDLLKKIKFPLGNKEKSEVRKLAEELDLPTSNREESQDFIGGSYTQLFDEDTTKPGKIVNEEGAVLGEHDGIVNYTVGQRRGLGISHHSPLYVKEIDAENNRLIVSERQDLLAEGLIATDINLLADDIDSDSKYGVKVRKNSNEAAAEVEVISEDKLKILFDEPQFAVSPGQSAVIYEDDRLIGGGVIKERLT